MTSNDQLRLDFDEAARRWSEQGPATASRLTAGYHFMSGNWPARNDDVLDIGCGPGEFARLLAPRCGRLLALDISPEMIRLARELSAEHPNIVYQIADVTLWDFPLARFDCVYSINALHHVPLEAMLASIRKTLRPGGVLLVLDIFLPSGARHLFQRVYKSPRRRTRLLFQPGSRDSRKRVWTFDPNEPKLPFREIRKIFQAELPGARIVVLDGWRRYSAVWTKAEK